MHRCDAYFTEEEPFFYGPVEDFGVHAEKRDRALQGRGAFMKITDSAVVMDSRRAFSERYEHREELRFWIDTPGTARGDMVSISEEAMSRSRDTAGTGADPVDADGGVFLERLITEILSGRKIRVLRLEELTGGGAGDMPEAPADAGEAAAGAQGWGLDCSILDEYREKETVRFDAKGVVRTSDGKEFAFSLTLEMNREYVEQRGVRVLAGDALKDPLVINLDAPALEFSGKTYAFDIDSDGAMEALAGLSAGSGYLAFDRDGNAVIDNGTELFGPSTGDAFSELARYDSDGNGWIDEADGIFQGLRVLGFDGAGAQVLRGMKEAGVGAISLAHGETAFDLKDGASNATLGRVRATGVYLTEGGAPGTLQQVDLKV
jgi:hypothetical protein